jgi:hypothetical protein
MTESPKASLRESSLNWRRSGDRGVHYCESPLGVFRLRALNGGRGHTVLTLNDVRIDSFRDLRRARERAEQLVEGVLADLQRRGADRAAPPLAS